MKKRRWAWVGVALALTLSSCACLASWVRSVDDSFADRLSSPVWLADGSVYYLRTPDNSALQPELRRRDQDGVDTPVVLDLPGCASPYLQSLTGVPSGQRLLVRTECAGPSWSVFALTPMDDGGLTGEPVFHDHAYREVAVLDDGRTGFVTAGDECDVLFPLVDGQVGAWDPAVALGSCPTEPPGPASPPCSFSGVGEMAIAADSTLYYLATRDVVTFWAPATWSLCRLDPHRTAGVELAGGLRRSGDLHVTGDGSTVLLIFGELADSHEHGQVIVLDTATQRIRTVAMVSALDVYPSPDGTRAVITQDGTRLAFVAL